MPVKYNLVSAKSFALKGSLGSPVGEPVTSATEPAGTYITLGKPIKLFSMMAFPENSLVHLKKKEKANELFKLDFKNEKSYSKGMSANSLAAYLFETKKDKEQALKYITTVSFERYKISFLNFLIYLWNNKIPEALDSLFIEISLNLLSIDFALQFLISKKQYHVALNLFNDVKYELKDKYKPLYFALMHFMKDEYPNEYLKMGSELEPIVKEIIANINQLAIDYA